MASGIFSADTQSLQQQAFANARAAFERLKDEGVLSSQLQTQGDPVAEIVKVLEEKYVAHRGTKRQRILQRFYQYTQWLRNFSGTVDSFAQAQGGIALVWAPMKFVLEFSEYHVLVAEQVLQMIEVMKDNLPRLEIYEKLSYDIALQTALLNVYTDIVEYSLQIFRFIRRRSSIRIGIIVATSFNRDLGECLKRLERHARDVDSTANAVQHLRAQEFQAKQNQNNKEEFRSKIEQWLSPANVDELLDRQLDEKMSGTCDWIWTQPAFSSWKNVQNGSPAVDRLLYIAGVQGCGKSILASSMVNSMRQQRERVLFYSFSGTDATRQTFGSLARSLIWQLLCDTDSDQAREIMRELMFKGPPIASSLSDTLNSLALLTRESLCCIIDALDECQEPIDTVFKYIIKFFEASKVARGVLLGRSHVIERLQPAKHTIEITPSLVQDDIDRFVRTAISDSSNLRDPEISKLAFEAIKSGSQGMFLWVKLMVDSLNRPSSKAEIMKRLHNLPIGLEKTYRQIFSGLVNSLDRLDLEFLQSLMKLAIVARRPLALEDAQWALAIASWASNQASDTSPFQDFMVQDPLARIRQVCGSLIHVRNNIVSLSHFSIQEYLTRPVKEWSCDESGVASWLRVDFDQAHHFFASICLDYLLHGDYKPLLVYEESMSDPRSHTLLEYAAVNVIYHVSRCERTAPDLNEKIHQLSKYGKLLSWIQHLVMGLLEDGSPDWESREMLGLLFWIEDDNRKEELAERMGSLIIYELQKHSFRKTHENWRTAQTYFLLDVVEALAEDFQNAKYKLSGDTDNVQDSSQPQASTPALLQSALDAIAGQSPRWLEELKSDQVSVIKRLNIFLRIHRDYHLEASADSFENLITAVISDAEDLPIFLLISAYGFCIRTSWYERALLLCNVALAKLATRDVLVKYIILSAKGQAEEYLHRYSEAEQSFHDTAKGAEKVFGPAHKITLFALLNWGIALGNVADGKNAETVLRKVWDIRKRMHGEQHITTLITEQRVAQLMFNEGKYEESEELFRHSMEIALRVYGPRHEVTLDGIFYVAFYLCRGERHAEAEPLYYQLVEGFKQNLGVTSQPFLFCLHRLGEVLIGEEKFAKAEEVLREELNIRTSKSFLVYDEIVRAMQTLSTALLGGGKREEGEQMIREALKFAVEHLGGEHERTLSASVALGNYLHDHQQFEEAVTVRRDIVESEEKKLGSRDASTLLFMQDLAKSLSRDSELPENQQPDRYVFEVYKKTLGLKDRLTMLAMENLAQGLSDEKKYVKAQDVLQDIINAKEEILGSDHESTLGSMEALELVLVNQGKYEEAESVLHSMLEIRKQSLGADHQLTLDTEKALKEAVSGRR